MARVILSIDDPAHRLTLKAMLEAAGHQIVDDQGEVRIVDSAGRQGGPEPRLILATVNEVPEALRAMEQGAFGYILMPFQPGEAQLMVARAASAEGPNRPPAEEGRLKTLQEVEEAHILDVLRQCKHNQAKAARVLGIGRNTLWRKLKRIREKSGDA